MTTLNKLRQYLDELTSHVTFQFKGQDCGIDPISHTHFNLWYGDETLVAKNIDEVFNTPLFDGKSLNEVFSSISNLE